MTKYYRLGYNWIIHRWTLNTFQSFSVWHRYLIKSISCNDDKIIWLTCTLDNVCDICDMRSRSVSSLWMVTPWNRNIFRTTGHLCAKFAGQRWIPRTKASERSFDVFLDLRLNKRLSKQWQGWWFKTPSRPLWRHCNGNYTYHRLAIIKTGSSPATLSRKHGIS